MQPFQVFRRRPFNHGDTPGIHWFTLQSSALLIPITAATAISIITDAGISTEPDSITTRAVTPPIGP